ncbi:GAF domain-containing sensor histidine kinase [Cohnella massiliensis]|uniref:GAF domain-containing sensor histidine kinase n=1 Tax=Cohnella massiliensis TaxID=1816691 RepID=UPI0009BBAF69|nr:histidine kinase [Cohnella massiliensis]
MKTEAGERLRPNSPPGVRSHPEGWLSAVRWLSLAINGAVAYLFLAKIPTYFAYMRDECHRTACEYAAITPLPWDALERLNLTEEGFAYLYCAIALIFFAIYCSVALLILAKRPREPFSYLASVALIAFPSSLMIRTQWREWEWLGAAAEGLSFVSLILLLLLFPNGKAGTKLVAGAVIALAAIRLTTVFFPDEPWGRWPFWVTLTWFVLQYGLLILDRFVRYRRTADAVERQQTKWVVYGFLLSLTGLVVVSLLPLLLRTDFYETQDSVWMFVLDLGVQLVMLPIPITVGISVMRKRLWDIDPIVGRTIVYAGLSASIVALYSFTVWYLSVLFRTGQNMFFSLAAAGVVAVLFAPLKERLQRLVNRMMYGEQSDPFSVLFRLGNRLKETVTPEEALDTVVRTVKDSLRVPYAGIRIVRDGAPSLAAQRGDGQAETAEFPLAAGGQEVGTLLVAARSPGEAFGDADRRLIEALCRQAGIVVQSVGQSMDIRRLLTDLQESKEQLIFAREEERRTMRRNLHDDIAPRLAAMRLTASLVADWIRKDPNKAIEIVQQFQKDIGDTVEEIRSIVYDLRPAALDELGLVGAVRQRMEQLENIRKVRELTDAPPLRMTLDCPEALPLLPAAVEVGAYRIATEALVNVVKHAQASECRVRIAVEAQPDPELAVEVTDDGIGLAERIGRTDGKGGLGLTSLRERAAELGGFCVIEKLAGGGTRIEARLPLKSMSYRGGAHDNH